MKSTLNKNKILLFLSYLLIIITILFLIWGILNKYYYVIPMCSFLTFYMTITINRIKNNINK